MAEKYFIGVDDGTQSVRVVIYDSKGAKLCYSSEPHKPIVTPQVGWAEHEMDDLWDSLCRASNKLMEKFEGDPAQIAGIGLSSQRATVAAVDKEGKMLCNPISWLDTRFFSNFATLTPPTRPDTTIGEVFTRFTSKFNWHKLNAPELYEKVYKYMNFGAYFGHQLTGEDYMDSVANSLGWPYDPNTFSVAREEICEEAGLTQDMMPKIVPSCTLMGKVTEEAAKLSGFPVGCPVFTCAGDKQCELIGADVLSKGEAYATLGTLCGLDVVADKFTWPQDNSYMSFFSPVTGLFNSEVSVTKGFWIVSWFRDNLGIDLKRDGAEKGCSAEELLGEAAAKIPAGSEGLVVLPDWHSPLNRPGSKGAFIGFDARHTRAHMYRALLEAIALDVKRSYDNMAGQIGCEIKSLRIGGGGSKSALVAQIFADVFGVPVTRTSEFETCSLGAAMCAAVGSGTYTDLHDAAAHMVEVKDSFNPIPENQAVYKKINDTVLDKLYPSLSEVYAALAQL